MESQPVEMVELVDPKTQKFVYVNIKSGECFAELPPNSFLYRVTNRANQKIQIWMSGGNYSIRSTI
jgi:hypothetical protein